MNYDYQTTHETSEKTMTHHMSAGYKVLVDFKNLKVITSRNGEVIDRMEMEQVGSLKKYEQHLARVAEAAETMKSKGL